MFNSNVWELWAACKVPSTVENFSKWVVLSLSQPRRGDPVLETAQNPERVAGEMIRSGWQYRDWRLITPLPSHLDAGFCASYSQCPYGVFYTVQNSFSVSRIWIVKETWEGSKPTCIWKYQSLEPRPSLGRSLRALEWEMMRISYLLNHLDINPQPTWYRLMVGPRGELSGKIQNISSIILNFLFL